MIQDFVSTVAVTSAYAATPMLIGFAITVFLDISVLVAALIVLVS